MRQIMDEVPLTRINSPHTSRLPGDMNFTFQSAEGESLLIKLDMAGVYKSSGPACTLGSLDPSHVLLVIGLSYEIAHSSPRLALNGKNTKERVDYMTGQIKDTVGCLRGMPPLYEDYIKHDDDGKK